MALPVYEMMINPEEGSDVEVSFVALVDKPAIERNFLAFNSQHLYFKADPEKRIIAGPAMVADTLIYRRDAGGEYNVFFSAATIREIALKFSKKGYAKNLNLFHDPNMPADGVTVKDSFVSDKSIGVMPMAGFEDLPDGSWFISAKVDNDEIWNRIKSGEIKGFSVEGNFSFVQNGQKHDSGYIIEKGLMSDIKTLLASLKASLFSTDAPPVPVPNPAAPVAAAAVTANLKDGTAVSITDLAVGGVVTMNDVPAVAGDYELEDGTMLTVGEGGVISAVTPAAVDPAAPPPATDYTKEFASVNEKFAAYEQRFSGYEAKFTAYEERFTQQKQAIDNANGTIVKLVSIVEQLAQTPTADPASQSGGAFSEIKQDKNDRLKELSDNLKKLKTA